MKCHDEFEWKGLKYDVKGLKNTKNKRVVYNLHKTIIYLIWIEKDNRKYRISYQNRFKYFKIFVGHC